MGLDQREFSTRNKLLLFEPLRRPLALQIRYQLGTLPEIPFPLRQVSDPIGAVLQ